MDLLSLLIMHVGGSAAKFLLKNWLGGTGEVAGGLVDLAKDKIKDVAAQREAVRQFERIGDKVAKRLLAAFPEDMDRRGIKVEAVVREVELTLDAQLKQPDAAAFFLTRNLDPARLEAALRNERPVPPGTFSQAESDLFERVFPEAVRYLVSVAGALPRFTETLAADTLTRLDEVQGSVDAIKADTRRLEHIEVKLKELANMEADLEKVLDTTERIERQVVGMASGVRQPPDSAAHAASRFEADYRHAVTQNLDYLELFGADILPESRRHSLSVAYVSLNLQRHGRKHGQADDMLPAAAVLNDLCPDAGRLLLRGEAGSGKSTLFRWAAIVTSVGIQSIIEWVSSFHYRHLVAYERGLTQELYRGDSVTAYQKDWRNRLPFLIRLRDCTAGKLPSPDDFPEIVAKQAGHPPQGWVRDVLNAGRGLMLLDGVDEIPGEFRDATLYGEIEAIVRAFPDNYFLVSTRPEAVPEGWLDGLGFREARINPMSDTDKGRFIDKWHEAVGQELAKRGGPTTESSLGKLADELKEKLAENPPINRLATNPLMCAMICALHRERRQKLPESQSELVEALCHMLLHRRELESGLRLDAFPEPYRKLTYSQKKLIVQDLAYHMVVNKRESVIARHVAEQLVAARLAAMSDQRAEDAPVVLRSLIERSGMLQERTPERTAADGEQRAATIEFLHNTFKEYLAALRLVHEHDADGLLASHALEPDWLPIVLFAAATDKPAFASRLIRKILAASEWVPIRSSNRKRRRSAAEQMGRQRYLIALRCKAVALDIEPKLLRELRLAFGRMFPPRAMADAEALAASGDLALPFLGYNEELNQVETAACVRALRLIGTAQAKRRLRSYSQAAKRGQRTILNELAQAMNPLEIPAVQELVQEPIETQDESDRQQSIRFQIVDVSPLANVTGLTTLDLGRTRITDLSPLAGLISLTSLDLRHTPLRDLSPLAALSRLTELHLGGTQVSDLSPLAGLKKLASLHLGETPANDLSPLAGLSELTLLILGREVSELSPLAGLSRLKSLDASGAPVSDLSPLIRLGGLHYLDFSQTQVTDLSPLAELKGLTSLDIGGTRVSDLSPLAKLSDLTELDLIGTQVADLSPLAGLKKLEIIHLSRYQAVHIPESLEKCVKRVWMSGGEAVPRTRS